MSDRFKQRLVGALVLVALAVVFLPVLFNLEPRRPLDQTSQIPPAPEVEPVEVDEPREPEVTSEPPLHEQAFQPDAASEPPSDGEGGQAMSPEVPETEAIRRAAEAEEASDVPDTEPPETEPRLAESGLPAAWVVQAASYRDAAGAEAMADRLMEAGFKAFVRSAEVDGAEVHRVFVGPMVLRKRAEEQKARIDASLGVDSLVLPYEP